MNGARFQYSTVKLSNTVQLVLKNYWSLITTPSNTWVLQIRSTAVVMKRGNKAKVNLILERVNFWGKDTSKQINQQTSHSNTHPFSPSPMQLVDIVLKHGTAAHMCFIRLSGRGRSRQKETAICMQAHRGQWERGRSWTNSQTPARNIFHPCFKIRVA